ncbi:MAG: YidC/Oxa1 family insertase periplasmic-domain containing protein, partial [Planctomycetota bacterium]
MNPRIRRIVITAAVLVIALGVVLIMVLGPKPRQPGTGPATAPATAPVEQTEARDQPGEPPTDDEVVADAAETPEPPRPEAEAPAETAPLETLVGLHAVTAPAEAPPPGPLGSLDAKQDRLLAEFSLAGAGVERITLSEFWQTAEQSRRARAHYRALDRGDPNPPPLPPDTDRYVLQDALPYDWLDTSVNVWRQTIIPLLAAHSVVLNDVSVSLLDASAWTVTAKGDTDVTFEATIADEDDREIARITRTWILGDSYDLTNIQRITNLTDAPLKVQWIQYGPGDLIVDRARYMDRRRFRIGYLPDPVNLPNLIASGNRDMLVEHGQATKRADKAGKTLDPDRQRDYLSLWPNEASRAGGFGLSWFASTNRYFALAVHPVLDTTTPGAVTGSLSLESVVADILLDAPPGPREQRTVFTGLYSPATTVAPGAEASFDLGLYAGPQDGRILGEQEPMASLHMKGLILYQMSSMCAICTFQWLAIGLLKFLSGVHIAIGDWGLAIILLVAVVRTLLHPLTKKAQVNMQRFGKAMGDLKPEIEKLQKKYPNDPKKLQ